MRFPTSHPSVISVAGIDDEDNPYGGSGSAPDAPPANRHLLDFVAPAVSVRSLKRGGGSERGTGTSQATAM